MGNVIGIDIGGTNFRIGCVSENGEVSRFRKIPVGEVFRGGSPMTELTAFLRDYGAGEGTDAIAIGFPATLDARRRTVLQAPNVAFMENLPVAETLERAFRLPIFLERDVTLALEYDCGHFRIPPDGIVCGFYFGTGIGNAIAVDGRPLSGRHGTAGELGHIPVDGNREVCGCGNVGCMETLAGGRYLAQLQKERWPEINIGDLFVAHGQDPLLRQFVDRMAMAVATEINILDPGYILIGGGIPAMAGFPREELLERIRFHARKPEPAESLHVLFTEDEETKCVRGAAMYARKHLK